MKKIFLTIDDSPSPQMKEKVDFLVKNGIPAIFFCIGEKMEAFPEMVKYAIQNGFAIGNHSYNHPHFSTISFAEIKAQIVQTEAILDDLFAQAGRRRIKYFRFPYGDKGDGLKGQLSSFWRKANHKKKSEIQIFLKQQGFVAPPLLGAHYSFYEKANFHVDIDWHWTFDTIDYSESMTDDEILTRLRNPHPHNPLKRRMKEDYWISAKEKSEIVLLHDYEGKHELFFKIVKELQQLPLVFQNFS